MAGQEDRTVFRMWEEARLRRAVCVKGGSKCLIPSHRSARSLGKTGLQCARVRHEAGDPSGRASQVLQNFRTSEVGRATTAATAGKREKPGGAEGTARLQGIYG
jgi:hypothetical protein